MENIKDEILDVINTIPDGISPLEKVRWIYIKLGKLLAFDNKEFDSSKNVSLDSDYIDKYQTCVTTSILLNEILNNIDPNIKCEVVERKLQNRPHRQEHLANILTFNNNGYEEKYLLDLTLDLYRIHFDLKTEQFGYCGHENYNLDIIPQVQNDEMDKKLGLYKNGYTNYVISDLKNKISFVDFSSMTFEEEIDFKLAQSKFLLDMNNTYSETNEFIYIYLVDYILECDTIRSVIRHGNEQKYVYIFHRGKETVWYVCDEDASFYKTSSDEIRYLFDNGWINNKGIIYDCLDSVSSKLLS